MKTILPQESELSSSYMTQAFVLPEDVEEEAKIVKIDFYRRSYLKLFVYYFLSIITLGLVALGAKWKLSLRVLFKYSQATPRNAEYMIIQSEDTTLEHVAIQVKTLQIEENPKPYRVFNYRLYTYYFDIEENIFKPIQFLIKDKTYKQMHEEFGQGILSNAQYEQRVMTYGDNSTNIPMKSNLKILVDEILSPFYIFQVFSIGLWFSENYVVYAIVILIISITSIAMSFMTIKRNYVKLRERSYFEATVQVFRSTDGNPQNLQPATISSLFLVPGDLIEIPDDQIMPCDIVLLKGTCIMNESMLTGESVPVIKHQIPSSQKMFDAHADSAHILYSGTKCLETKKNNKSAGPAAVGVVLRTGFSTMKGRLIRSLLYSKPENFKFYRDSIKYIGAMACIALICFLFSLKAFIEQGASIFVILKKSLDIFTIAVPPALATCLSIGCEIASNRLEKKGVITKSQTKINVAGRVEVMCFDKTGTLTEDSLDLYGVKPVGETPDNTIKFLKTVKKNVGNDMNKISDGSQKKQKTLSHMMLELMATCHSLTHVKGVLSGDPLDLKMFNAIEWEIQEQQANSPGAYTSLCAVRPSMENSRPEGYYDENSKVFVIKRFDFASKLQRMSVIVRDPKENRQRVYVKGSPEMLRELCKPETIPEMFSYALSQYAQNGLRVIACGTRELEDDVRPLDNLERENFENNLDFLGFMVFENRLKPATNGIIKKLNEADIKTVMLTGDNPLTAIFIARSCGILEADKKVMLAVLKISDEDSSVKNLEWQYIEPSKIDDKAEDVGPNKTENNEETLVLDVIPVKLKENPEHNDEEKTIEVSQSAQLDRVYQDPNIAIAMTGEALSYLKASNSNPVLYRTALRKAKVFARMRPEEKALVVEEFQKQDYTVGMCGDGANDCPALKAANVGVSLSEAEASIAAPFLSKINDITCIDIVLREGRAALTTSFQCFKYMSMYSFIQTLSVVSLYSRKSSLTDESFLFIDLFLILPLAITMSYTTARNKLSKTRPSSSLLSMPIISSIIGQLLIQAFFQVLLITILPSEDWYIDSLGLHPGDNDINHLNVSYDSTALFLVANFQYIATVLAFSVGKPFRKSFYTNKKFVLTIIMAVFASVFIVYTNSETILDAMELLKLPQGFRGTIIIMAIANSTVTLCYEKFVVQCLTTRISEAKKNRKYLQN